MQNENATITRATKFRFYLFWLVFYNNEMNTYREIFLVEYGSLFEDKEISLPKYREHGKDHDKVYSLLNDFK